VLVVTLSNSHAEYLQALYKDTSAALQELLRSVLAKDPTPDGLQRVFKVKPVPLMHLHSILFSNLGEQEVRTQTCE